MKRPLVASLIGSSLPRTSGLLCLQVRPVRARAGGAALPVAARQREPGLPRQDQEGKVPSTQGDLPQSLHREDVLQTRRKLHAGVILILALGVIVLFHLRIAGSREMKHRMLGIAPAQAIRLF